jgi:hypothetical protein
VYFTILSHLHSEGLRTLRKTLLVVAGMWAEIRNWSQRKRNISTDHCSATYSEVTCAVAASMYCLNIYIRRKYFCTHLSGIMYCCLLKAYVSVKGQCRNLEPDESAIHSALCVRILAVLYQ